MPRVRPAPRVASVALLALAALAGAGSLGCALESPPSTLEIADLEPHEVDVGEHLEIVGSGFPVGRPARVTFRGEAHRPGQEPEKVRVELQASAESSERLDLVVTDALSGPVCGRGDGAMHATFRGELAVAFEPAHAGTAPLVGRASQVVLDVRPAAASPLARRRAEDEGRKTLAFLGVRVGERAAAAGGIAIEGVDPGSRAASAGLRAGEILTEVDGVRVVSLADVVPVGGHAATLVVRTALGTDARVVRVSIEGLKTRISPDVIRAGVLVGGALALLALLLRPSAGGAAWLERRLAGRAARRSLPTGRAQVRGAVEGWLSSLERLEAQGAAGLAERWGVWSLVLLGYVALPLGQGLLGFDLDVATPYLLVGSLLAALGFVGARDAAGRWSLGGALETAGRALAFELPAALAVACVVVPSGSLRLDDVSRSQGGWPWAWAAFRSPAALAAFVAVAALAIPARVRGRQPRPETAERDAIARGRAPLVRLADEASAFAFGGVAAAVFCGAWEIPGVPAIEREAWWGFQLLGAALFAAKASGLALVVLALRRALPRLSAPSLLRVLCAYVAPVLGLAIAASVGFMLWHPSRGAALAVQLATFGVASAALVALAARLLYGVTTITARHVDPRA